MSHANANAILGAMMGLAAAGTAGAATVNVTTDIATSTTWTSDNVYNLVNQVYVLPGATLTIEPGTVVASTPTANGAGSLAITRGAKIYVNGTAAEPVIMTSSADDFATWREAANEWGNLTIMGQAYISNSFVPGNTASPNPNNISPMEGLIPDFAGDPNTLYGGGNDDDDSGSISYLSIRYGGRVVGLGTELNGLSLGGIGRATDIHHVEIMNNVDDGIEIWGGTVNLKYFSIWNVGDDSFDVDQGWRGKAQFGLIVQGYSVDASQGSGVGDNCFETDGAEDSDAQPVTTAVAYNCTVIGQPAPGAGDGGTVWRDNARFQYRNCIFMDLGEKLVRFDDIDGDGSHGYGWNGTLSWEDTWTTNYAVTSPVNAPANPAAFYQAMTSGKLAVIRDSIFFRNLDPDAYTEATARGVLSAGVNNTLIPGFDAVDAPIVSITRGGPVTRGGKTMLPVISLDPRPANEAVSGGGAAPDDGFYTPVEYRGAFGPDENWLCGWSAADQYGFLVAPPGGCVVKTPCDPDFSGDGMVGFSDLTALLANWGPCPGGSCPWDLSGDGMVGFSDLTSLLANWGACP